MQKVYGGLKKEKLAVFKFAGAQCLEHFCSKGRTILHCQKVEEIPGYGGKLHVTDFSSKPKCMF